MLDERTRVLLVEDNPGDVRFVRELLREDGLELQVSHVSTVREAIEHLSAEKLDTDAVLLDLSLPDETGLNTVRRIVSVAREAVVVVMTGDGDEELGLRAMEAGAQDYLVKSQVTAPLLRRALRFALGRQFARRQMQHTDDLTHLSNRRGFLLLAEQQIKVARRQKQPFLVLFMDLDQLKRVNDTFGHAEGNRALVEAAEVLRGSFRQSDLLARYGGDEFAALSLCSGPSDAEVVRARLDTVLARINGNPDRAYPLGFSVGMVTCLADEPANIEQLLERADTLMYLEKKRKAMR
ncbi:MAG: GGDEF domain-containing response regulator [Vicinamibacterales bacterium]